MTLHELQKLSRPVARSFHLTLVLLPRSMRHPALLAYLLARLSDAVADAPGPFSPAREELLLRWQAEPWHTNFPEDAFPSTATPGERSLWVRRAALWQALRVSPHRDLIQEVWREILWGQITDLRRERMGEASCPLPWPEVLHYAGAVAGSVGIFWTKLIAATCPGALCGREEVMAHYGRSYGVALQLVNILRDASRDQAVGRAYLHPADYTRALQTIANGLSDGRRYGLGLRGCRLRLATALPERIARDMLPPLTTHQPSPKITRPRLAQLAADTLWHSLWK
jgi:farnesyl-diphosphate farnesyltransferase